jgi:hypothetical protein
VLLQSRSSEFDFSVQAYFDAAVILDSNLRGIDEVGTAVTRLNAFGRKLTLCGYPTDGSVVFNLLVCSEISDDSYLLTELDVRQLVAREIRSLVHILQVRHAQ